MRIGNVGADSQAFDEIAVLMVEYSIVVVGTKGNAAVIGVIIVTADDTFLVEIWMSSIVGEVGPGRDRFFDYVKEETR